MSRVATTSLVTDIKSTVDLTYDQVISSLQMPVYVWIAMILLAATGLCYSINLHTRNELNNAKLEYQRVTQEYQQIEMENAHLVRQLDLIDKDPRTVETLAREAGMIAADETVVFLPTNQNKSDLRK